MNLKYKLPKKETKLLNLSDNESIWYCAPYDIYKGQGFESFGYVVVTEERLLVLNENIILEEILLTDCEKIHCEALVDNGILVVRKDNVDHIVARFSMKHLSRFSYIARGAELLARDTKRLVVSKESERICDRCGRGLPGTSSCPHCDGRFLTLKRFWKLCGDHQLRLVLVSLLMVIASFISLYMPEIQKRFIDNVLYERAGGLNDVLVFVGQMAALTTALLAVNLIKNWWCATLGAGISMDLREKLYNKLQDLSLSFIQRRRPGELINRVVWDTAHVRAFMENIFSNMFSTLVTMVGALIAMLIMNPFLTLLSTVFVIFVVVLNRVFRQKTRRMFRAQSRKADKLNSSLQDVISGIRVVKSFGKEKEEAQSFREETEEFAIVQEKNEVFWAYFYPLVAFIMGIGTYVATFFGGALVLDGNMTTGELIQFITYTGALFGPLGWMNHLPRSLRRMVNSLERIYDVLDEEPDIVDGENAKVIDIKGEVEFRNVSFGYKTYEQVLTNVNLEVEPGEMIGLVGSSGTGKSTMINLIMRLYDVEEGAILIDGVDLRDISIDSLHSQLGIVLQETFLFTGTVFNNIRFAKPDASQEEVIAAAKAANAHDFIAKMPDGYNTYIGERGFTVSGGERQRIAIARAILNDPRILILDEATSSLDTESEYLIQEALNRLRKGRTTFAIAHRLSTLREADRIVVIDNHKIAEMGSHNELLEKKGIYHKLVAAQLEMQKVDNL